MDIHSFRSNYRTALNIYSNYFFQLITEPGGHLNLTLESLGTSTWLLSRFWYVFCAIVIVSIIVTRNFVYLLYYHKMASKKK